jgi:hypothetical protein
MDRDVDKTDELVRDWETLQTMFDSLDQPAKDRFTQLFLILEAAKKCVTDQPLYFHVSTTAGRMDFIISTRDT